MFVIVDCETTGLFNKDRVVEVAAVVVDGTTGKVVDEYDTLVNPLRDTGPVGKHGVTASMVEAAPTFEEIAGALSHRLDGNVLVAHNLIFDSRMLHNEYQRLNCHFDPGHGHCTLRLTSERLERACARYDIALKGHHSALVDARATAELFLLFLEDIGDGIPATVQTQGISMSPRTLRRDANIESPKSPMSRIVSRAQYPTSDADLLAYLDMLNWVLDDLVITQTEQRQLDALAAELGIGSVERQNAHIAYTQSIIAAAKRDRIITDAERSMIETVSSVLGLASLKIPDVSAKIDSGPLVPGLRICFTGEAIVDGENIRRSDLEAWAAQAGLQPVPNVTKKGCDLLVAADVSSMSGKTKKARKYEKPVMSIVEFVRNIKARPGHNSKTDEA